MSVYISPQMWEQFYNPLVGTPERVQELTDQITQQIPPIDSSLDPYQGLQEAMEGSLRNAAYRIPSRTMSEVVQISHIATNSEVAILLGVAMLRGLGSVYCANARTEQEPDMVRRNTRRALLGVHQAAFLDRNHAPTRIFEMSSGRKHSFPGSRIVDIKRFSNMSKQHRAPIVSRKAFNVTENDDGQLIIKLRSKGIKPPADGTRCPATEHRTGEQGKKRSSLLLVMGVMGDVTNTAIYPQYFDIAQPTNEQVATYAQL